MKVLFIQPSSDKRGHYGLWTSKLCQAMAQQNVDLWLYTNKISPGNYLTEAAKFNIIECKNGKYLFTPYDQAKTKYPLYYWYGYFKTTYVIVKNALQWAQDKKFDAIYLTDVEYLTATLLLKQFKHKLPPVIWHVQAANFTYDTYAGSRIKKLYKSFQRQIFKTVIDKEVKGFAVLGEFHQQQLRKQLKVTVDFPIEVIPDGADINPEHIPKNIARDKLSINYNGNIILFLGMLRKDKGIEYLIAAASQLNNSDCKIIIAGAPFEWSAEAVKALIAKHQAQNKIDLRLGYISEADIAYYYQACDAVIFPYTDQYTGGCGPLSKGACTYNKPVIVTNVSDMGRVVNKYKNGLVAQPCDVQSLAATIEKFLALSEIEKLTMIRQAKVLAQRHAWDSVAKQLIAYLRDPKSYASTDYY